jgi:hypothetical protein
MAQRGRKSSAALSVVQIGTIQRPEPPADLTDHEKAEWNAVVAQMPADWFPRESHGLLKDYCRHRARSDMIAGMIALVQPDSIEDTEGLKAFRALLLEGRMESRAAASLAGRMRLSQNSRYKGEKAYTATKATSGQKPWQATG